ncbi:MAG: hypothetical protein HON04_13570 [Planctomicrobium sp.]|nr:hypothetical protein [Planctomicrobium sp.]
MVTLLIMTVKQKANSQTSIGLAASLLTACLVTLLSIIAKHEPETVLFRAFVGAIVVGGITSLLGNFLGAILAEQKDDDF